VRVRVLEAVILLAILAGGTWLRFRVHLGTFVNYDAAGIVYQGDLILRGGLPYRDALDMKAPGPFVITAAVFGLTDRSLHALHVFANLWIIGAGLVLWGLARRMLGRAPALLTLALFLWGSVLIDKIDFNYETWLALPYVASAYFAWRAAEKDAGWAFAASGACAVWAGLMRHQGMFIAALPVVMALVTSRRRRNVLWTLLGGAGAIAPLVLWYVARGAAGDLFGTLLLSDWGWRYVDSTPPGERLARFWEGLGGVLIFTGVPFILAACAAVGALFRSSPLRRSPSVPAFVVAFVLISFAGTAVGYRFYQSYFMQLLPALALPAGLVVAASPRRMIALVIGLCAAIAVVPVGRDAYRMTQRFQRERQRPTDAWLARVGRELKKSTLPSDRIFCWGRAAWPIYYYADRQSPHPVYKAWALLTTPNTNSLQRRSQPMKFVRSPQSDGLLERLEKNPPEFMILDGGTWHTWRDLKLLVRKRYDKQRKLSRHRVDVYRRKP